WTPLRHISGFVNVLKEEAQEQTAHPDPSSGFLDQIERSAERMNRLLDDLIGFSKVNRERMSTTAVDLEYLCKQVLHDLEPEIKERRIIWTRSSLPSVIGDRGMLQRVLADLIGNAVKYTSHENPAEIEIGHRIEGEEVILFIRDNGTGFDMMFA